MHKHTHTYVIQEGDVSFNHHCIQPHLSLFYLLKTHLPNVYHTHTYTYTQTLTKKDPLTFHLSLHHFLYIINWIYSYITLQKIDYEIISGIKLSKIFDTQEKSNKQRKTKKENKWSKNRQANKINWSIR